jgi:hypothetical protein
VDVRDERNGVGALGDSADDRPFGDLGPAEHIGRGELQERDRVAVGGLDRDRMAAAGHLPGEGHPSARRRDHGGAERGTHVDAAMLPTGVGVEGE